MHGLRGAAFALLSMAVFACAAAPGASAHVEIGMRTRDGRLRN